MARIRLIHWNPEEGLAKAGVLKQAGHSVGFEEFDADTLHRIREEIPDVVVIDLSRLPMQGRDIGLALRKYKSTRHVPLVFAGGLPQKISRVKEFIPDAIFTSWRDIRSAINRALKDPPADPVVPKSLLEGYSKTPLITKLGIKAGISVTLFGAPVDFEKTLGSLPEGVLINKKTGVASELVIWFVHSAAALSKRMNTVCRSMDDRGGLWIAWPKKSSGVDSDLSQESVRRIGLDSGLVDYKICSIDKTWSALKFTRRKR